MFYRKVFVISKFDVNSFCLIFLLSVDFSFFLIKLSVPLRSVSLILESFIYGLGFNSQTLIGSLQLSQVMR